jgi:hypothetical protein
MSLVGLASLNVWSYTKGDAMTAPRTSLDERFSLKSPIRWEGDPVLRDSVG